MQQQNMQQQNMMGNNPLAMQNNMGMAGGMQQQMTPQQ